MGGVELLAAIDAVLDPAARLALIGIFVLMWRLERRVFRLEIAAGIVPTPNREGSGS